MTAPLLTAKGLSVTFGGLKAVDGLDLEVMPGSIHALIGPNGAGKSTAVNVLTGFVPASGGSLFLDGREMTHLSPHRRARLGLARTFQNIRLFPSMTVLETVLTGAHVRFRSSIASVLLRRGRAETEEQELKDEALRLIDGVGLRGSERDIFASTLSYGHQRRVEIARALIARPRVLFLDEPLAGMNALEKDEVGELVRGLRDQGLTILLIEHDMQVVRSLADRITVLANGRRLKVGSPDEVFGDEIVQSAYLGAART